MTRSCWAQEGIRELHSHKQLAHWAVDVTAWFYVCWLSSWLKCNFSAAYIQCSTGEMGHVWVLIS